MTLSYCAQLVREQDSDRFLIIAMLPENVREDLYALFALNYEIAKTREVVSETMLGQIRLKWWVEAIESIYGTGKAPEHEILQALSKAISKHELRYEYFELFIHAREFDLEDVQPNNIEGFLNYCDFTTTPLFKLAVQIISGDPDLETVQPVAMNYALVGLMRSVPFHAGQSRCYLPEDVLHEHKISVQGLYQNKPNSIADVLKELSAEFVKGVSPENKFLKLSQALSEIYFLQLKRNKFDPFVPAMQIDPAFKALRLWLSSYL